MKKLLLTVLVGILLISLSSATLSDGVVSFWKLDGIAGDVADVLGVNNGTLPNGATRGITGIVNNAFNLSLASSQFINTTFQPDIPNRTASAWFFANDITPSTQQSIFNFDGTSASVNGGIAIGLRTNGSIRFIQGDTTVFSSAISTGWHQVVITQNTTSVSAYLDGILVDTISNNTFSSGDVTGSVKIGAARDETEIFDGGIDEVGFWNRSLNQSEITELFDLQTAGITYPFINVTDFEVTLDAPDNDTIQSGNVKFNTTLIPGTTFNLTNATLFIWDSDNDLVFIETKNVTGNEANKTFFIVDNLTSGDYNWNVFGSSANSTGSVTSNFSEFNNTFTWVPFSVDSESFNTEVFETSRQEFFINITTLSTVLSVDAILNYNGTRFTSDTSCSSGLCQISTAIDIPLVSVGESENKSFFWEITIFDGTLSLSINLTVNEQNVTRLHLEKCDGTFTNQTLNFTAFEEENQTAVDPFMFDASFQFWLGTGSVKRNNSISEASISSLQLCFTPATETLLLDGTVEYDEAIGTNYTNRNYFFQSDTINNVSQDIRLGLLLAEDSTSFILKVQDRDILPVANVLIFTERFYPGEGIFKVVQVSETDDNGRTVGFFQTETVEYRFILRQNGATVLTTNKQKIVGESVPFTLTFTIGEDEGASWEPFEEIDNLTSQITFNKTSNIVSFTYLDTSGDFELGRLIVERINASGLQNTIICSETSVQSSATITCNLTGNSIAGYIARGIITRDGTAQLVEQTSFAIEDFSTIAGRLGLFLGWFVILISIFTFKFNEVAGIILVNLSIIFVNLIGLISFGYVFISAMIAISIIILVVLER